MKLSGTKVCVACREIKDLGEFFPDRRASNGKQGVCRKCRNGRDKKRRRERNPSIEAILEEKEKNRAAGLKKCFRCSLVLPLALFRQVKGNLDGRCGVCKGCQSERDSEYYRIPEVKARIKARSKSVVKNLR